ncbi:MAG: TorF family putative porin [Alphaproteobacteria bacterium]|nr:TorF family putative porin [Alphaproteobacteria bacterium]MDE2163592.1 TorF family putative porin [Alphaproteobacteria bacterium]MDE2500540.1 TorF family putative porin [Alphaproteobacteria bacterium]
MKKLGLKLSLAAALLAGVAVTNTAYADDAPSWGTLSAYVAVTSDYRYRGISQNSKEFAPQASVNWSGPDGFYAGTWLSKVNWGGNNPSFEMDLYAGKHTDLDGTDLNLEAYYYSYPDAKFPGTKASYYETIGQLSHVFGPLTLTLTGANSPEWSLSGGTGWYVEGTAAYALTDWLSISGNLGHQWVSAAPSDYTHYDIGGTATYKSWSLDARYVGSDISQASCAAFWMATPKACEGGFVATITYNIADLFQ